MRLTIAIDKPTESVRIHQSGQAAMQRRQSHRMFSLERLVAALAFISWLSFTSAGEQGIIHPLEPSLLSGGSWPTDSALDSLFSRARVVMIGESIHGTAQFPQLREALSRYLAKRFAFRILALEGPYASCLNPVTSAIAREAFVTEVRRCIPSNWYTEESVDALWHLVADPSGPRMKIYGFDIQPTELLSAPEYVARVEAAVSGPASDLFATDVTWVFRTIHEHLWEKVDGVGYLTRNSARLNHELERLTNEAASRKTTVPQAARQVLASEAHFLTYWQAVESGDWRNFMVLRDRGMADNLASIVTANPSEKILVWAHNGLVAMSRQYESDAPTPLMGELIHARFGPSVVSVAMLMGKGSVDRRKGQTIDVPAPSSGVVESLLMSYPIAFVLPKQLCRMDPVSSVGHFAMRDNGTIEVQYNCDPSAFDALFFVRDASRPKYLY